jgi:hypothetical protein
MKHQSPDSPKLAAYFPVSAADVIRVRSPDRRFGTIEDWRTFLLVSQPSLESLHAAHVDRTAILHRRARRRSRCLESGNRPSAQRSHSSSIPFRKRNTSGAAGKRRILGRCCGCLRRQRWHARTGRPSAESRGTRRTKVEAMHRPPICRVCLYGGTLRSRRAADRTMASARNGGTASRAASRSSQTA